MTATERRTHPFQPDTKELTTAYLLKKISHFLTFRVFHWLSLLWHLIMACQITGNSTLCSTVQAHMNGRENHSRLQTILCGTSLEHARTNVISYGCFVSYGPRRELFFFVFFSVGHTNKTPIWTLLIVPWEIWPSSVSPYGVTRPQWDFATAHHEISG